MDSTCLNMQSVHGHAIVDDRATTAIERRLRRRRGLAGVLQCQQYREGRAALLASICAFPRLADAAPAGASIREQGTMRDGEAFALS